MTKMTTKQWTMVGVVLLSVAFVVWASVFIYRTSFVAIDGRRYFSLFDDAMISMRYAWNLSHGEGLVWNPGERVEGYTNLLMVGLMSLFTSLLDKSSAVLAVQLTGIPILLGIGVLALLHWLELARGHEVSRHAGFGALVFMGSLLYYPLAYWTLMGMETGLLTLLLMGGSLLLLIYMRTGSYKALIGSSVVLGLGYLTRPDSAVVAVLLMCAATLLGKGSAKKRVSAAALGLSLYVLFPALQTGFRAIYYGSLVPVTYTLKMTGMPIGMRLANGLGFIRLFVLQARWAYLLGAAGAVLGFRKRKVVLIIPPLTLVAYQIFIGGDAWRYWRLLAPGIPYLILLTVAGVDWMAQGARRFAPRARARDVALKGRILARVRLSLSWLPSPSAIIAIGAAVLLVCSFLADAFRPGSPGFGYAQRYLFLGGLLLGIVSLIAREYPFRMVLTFGVMSLVLVSLNTSFLREAVLFSSPYQKEFSLVRVNESVFINRYTTEDASIGVFWAGIIPYYTDRYAIDFLGRVDPYIAGLAADVSGSTGWEDMFSVPGHNKYDLEYSVLIRHPTFVRRFRWGSQNIASVARDLYTEIDFAGAALFFLRGDAAVKWDAIPPENFVSQ